jgi:hypothetical protein
MKFAAVLAIPAILANAATIGLQQQNANVSKDTTPLPQPSTDKAHLVRRHQGRPPRSIPPAHRHLPRPQMGRLQRNRRLPRPHRSGTSLRAQRRRPVHPEHGARQHRDSQARQ